MRKDIHFYYYKRKEKIKRRTKLSEKVHQTFIFDTAKYTDTPNNHKNVISDYLEDNKITHYYLTIDR